jgi:hypothetical protein
MINADKTTALILKVVQRMLPSSLLMMLQQCTGLYRFSLSKCVCDE